MWLLNAETRRLEHIVDDGQISSPYAILSHTWEKEEVCFDDIHQEYATQMLGYRKIEYTCTQAIKDEIRYVWIDTCCIDKRSSAELSEAINSMYRWYYNAYVCYAYLADIQAKGENLCETHDRAIFVRMQPELSRSRWFTRGWTLQELIAPRKVEFYDGTWNPLGVKAEIVKVLSEITRISEDVLGNRDKLSSSSIAQRMSWAAGRETSRPEDIAYALLGLFDVNMPLLYGEGSKAFMRLQDEIIRSRDTADRDHSILVWQSYAGDLLAPSPGAFSGGHQISSWTSPRDESFELTQKGLRLSLFARPDRDSNAAPAGPGDDTLSEASLDTITVALNCHYDDLRQHRIALKLRRRPQVSTLGNRGRHEYHGDVVYDKVGDLALVSTKELQQFRTMELTISRKPFSWPHMPLQVSVSLPSARVRGVWPSTMHWVPDGQLNYNRQGGILNSHVLEPNVGYGNLLIGKEEDAVDEWQDMVLGIRIDRNTVPSRLFVGGSDEQFSEAWVDSHPLHALRAGEKREIHLDDERVFTMEASYVLQDNQLLWHLELSRPASMRSSSSLMTSSISTDRASRARRDSVDLAVPSKALVKTKVSDTSEAGKSAQQLAPLNQDPLYHESLVYLQRELAQLRLEQWKLQQTSTSEPNRSFFERGMMRAEVGLKSAFNKVFKRHEQSADDHVPTVPPPAMELYGGSSSYGSQQMPAELPAEDVPRYELDSSPVFKFQEPDPNRGDQSTNSFAPTIAPPDLRNIMNGYTSDTDYDQATIGANSDQDSTDQRSIDVGDGSSRRETFPVFQSVVSEELMGDDEATNVNEQNSEPASPVPSQVTARSNSVAGLRRSVAIRRSSSPFSMRTRVSSHKKGSLSLVVPLFGNEIVSDAAETEDAPAKSSNDGYHTSSLVQSSAEQAEHTPTSAIETPHGSAAHQAGLREGDDKDEQVSSEEAVNGPSERAFLPSRHALPVIHQHPPVLLPGPFTGMSSGPIPEFLEDFEDDKTGDDTTANEDSDESRSPVFLDRERTTPESTAKSSLQQEREELSSDSREVEQDSLSLAEDSSLAAALLNFAASDHQSIKSVDKTGAGESGESRVDPEAIINVEVPSDANAGAEIVDQADKDDVRAPASPENRVGRALSPLSVKMAPEGEDDDEDSEGQLTPSPSLVHLPSDMWFDGEGSLGLDFNSRHEGASSDEDEPEEDVTDSANHEDASYQASDDDGESTQESNIPAAPSRTPPPLPPPIRDPPLLPLPGRSNSHEASER